MLQIEGLKVEVGGKTKLENLDMEIHEGETQAFQGMRQLVDGLCRCIRAKNNTYLGIVRQFLLAGVLPTEYLGCYLRGQILFELSLGQIRHCILEKSAGQILC